jgi:hypothetical protein
MASKSLNEAMAAMWSSLSGQRLYDRRAESFLECAQQRLLGMLSSAAQMRSAIPLLLFATISRVHVAFVPLSSLSMLRRFCVWGPWH